MSERVLTREERERIKEQNIFKNELLLTVSSDKKEDFNEILSVTHKKMAYASAVIEEELKQGIPDTRKTRTALNLVDSLKNLSKSVLHQRQVQMDDYINLDSPKMQTVLAFFVHEVRECFIQCGFDKESQELYFRQLGSKFDGWTDKVQKQLKKNEAPDMDALLLKE